MIDGTSIVAFFVATHSRKSEQQLMDLHLPHSNRCDVVTSAIHCFVDTYIDKSSGSHRRRVNLSQPDE